MLENTIKILGVVVIVVLLATLMALPVMWLWNWLIPTIFGLTKVTLGQAWGLNVLCGFLFKSYPSNSSKSSKYN